MGIIYSLIYNHSYQKIIKCNLIIEHSCYSIYFVFLILILSKTFILDEYK